MAMAIRDVFQFVIFWILLQGKSRIAHAVKPTVHTRTFTIPLPPMSPGQILHTIPGNFFLGRMEMPKGHIAMKR